MHHTVPVSRCRGGEVAIQSPGSKHHSVIPKGDTPLHHTGLITGTTSVTYWTELSARQKTEFRAPCALNGSSGAAGEWRAR